MIRDSATMKSFDCKVVEEGLFKFPKVFINAQVMFSAGTVDHVDTNAIKLALRDAIINNIAFVEEKPKEGGAK